MIKRSSTFLILLVCCGCLQSVTPVPPVSTATLETTIKQTLTEERQGYSALANQVALTPVEADQKTLWLTNHEKIAAKAGSDIATAIKDEITKANGDASAISEVWKEVAKGYAP